MSIMNHGEKHVACVLLVDVSGSMAGSSIAELNEDTVVHRITGDGAKKDLIAPLWSADKKWVLNRLKEYLGLH